MENTYAYEVPEMNIETMFQSYATMKKQSVPFTRYQYSEGIITNFELFDTYLRYLGLIGYSYTIATAARICFAEDWS